VELLLGVSSDGASVAEAELTNDDPSAAVATAHGQGVDLLWLHAKADLTPFGFARRDGYLRMRADRPSAGESLPVLAETDYARTLDLAYRGLWGHKQVAPDAAPPPGAVVVGLYEDGGSIGICTVFPEERLVDGPGVVPGRREPAFYGRLLSGALRVIRSGPVDLDSWGDPPDVIKMYAALGFEIVEQYPGWELRLRS
jgi:hypothetical protein